jgi:hypothetical protein
MKMASKRKRAKLPPVIKVRGAPGSCEPLRDGDPVRRLKDSPNFPEQVSDALSGGFHTAVLARLDKIIRLLGIIQRKK